MFYQLVQSSLTCTCFDVGANKNRISLVFWATELDTTLSSSICQPASMNKSTSGNRTPYGFTELDMSTGLDELIDLGKPSSICRYRARIVEDGEARTLSDQFSFLGNRARYDFIELDMSTGLDKQIDLGKPSSIRVYRSRYINRPR